MDVRATLNIVTARSQHLLSHEKKQKKPKLKGYSSDPLLEKKNKCSNSNIIRVAVEDVVSGIGVSNAYECFLELYPDQVNLEVQNEYNHAGDLKGKVIGDNYNQCHICKKVIDTIMM